MLGDGFQYDLGQFWEFPNFDKIWALGPLYLLQKYFKQYKINPIPFKKDVFVKYHDLTF